MKKCPFCAESIQDDAIKCRFCKEFLNKESPAASGAGAGMKLSALIFAMVCLGPLAVLLLPLVWSSKSFSPATKKTVTIGTIIFAVLLTVMLVWATGRITRYYQEIFSALP